MQLLSLHPPSCTLLTSMAVGMKKRFVLFLLVSALVVTVYTRPQVTDQEMAADDSKPDTVAGWPLMGENDCCPKVLCDLVCRPQGLQCC